MGKIFGILFVALVLFLPQIASNDWTKHLIEKHLEKDLGGTVSIEKIQLKWFGKQKCFKVKWDHPEKRVSSDAQVIECQMKLTDWFNLGKKPLSLKISEAHLTSSAKFKFLKNTLSLEFPELSAILHKDHIDIEKTQVQFTDGIEMSLQGKLDLLNAHMDLKLGIGPRALEKMLKIKNLPFDFELEVPVKSKLNAKAIEKKFIKLLLKRMNSKFDPSYF